MIAASFLFACMGVCVKLAAETYPPSEIVFYRSFISLLMMVPVVRLHGITLTTPHWRFQLWRSAAGFVSLLMYFYAIFLLPLATAATLAYTSPLFLAIYLGLFRKTQLRSGMMVALVIGFAGVALLLRPTLHAEQLLGGLIGLGSGMLSGLAFFNIRELSERGEPEARTVFYFSLFSTVASGLWMLVYEFHPLNLRGGLLLLGVGGFATAAQLAMTRAYTRGNTLVSASLAYSTVIFASLFGMLFWQETLSRDAWLAVVLIIASGLVSTWFSRTNPAEQD